MMKTPAGIEGPLPSLLHNFRIFLEPGEIDCVVSINTRDFESGDNTLAISLKISDDLFQLLLTNPVRAANLLLN